MSVVKDWLKNIQAFSRRFPGQTDKIRENYWHTFAELLATISDDAERQNRDVVIAADNANMLFGVVRRSSAASVADGVPERLGLGLLALVLENAVTNPRRTLTELTLLDNSAQKLGRRLEDVYDEIVARASPKMDQLVRDYFAEGDRNIEAMGYVETVDSNGRFTYQQNW
jgi:hypothetical protein